MSKPDAAARLKALQQGGSSAPASSSSAPSDNPGGIISDVSDRDYGGNTRVIDQRGAELLKECERKLKKFSLFADKNRYEKCCQMYEEAGKCFRMNEDWIEAAEAFEKAAEMAETKLNRSSEAASLYCKAANAHRQIDLFDAVKDYQLAIAIYMNTANLKGAANVWNLVAEILLEESRIGDALEAYQKCASCHEAEDTMASAVQCYLAMAAIYLQNEDYDQAGLLFEKAAQISIEKKINIGSHIEYVFKALLCEFVIGARKWDLENVQKKMKEHLKINRRYDGTKEIDLLKRTIKAFEEEDIKEFKKAIAGANKIKELDDHTTQCLVQIQRSLLDGPREDDIDLDQEELDLQ